MSVDKAELAKRFCEAIPHARALGMRLEAIDEGRARLAMDYDPRFVGDPMTGVIHGGAVVALMDTCCGAAVMSHPTGAAGTATLDLRIDYMRPATPGQTIRAEAECYHVTRSVAFVRATAHDEDAEHPVASVAGAFTIERPRPRGAEQATGAATAGSGANGDAGRDPAGRNGVAPETAGRGGAA